VADVFRVGAPGHPHFGKEVLGVDGLHGPNGPFHVLPASGLLPLSRHGPEDVGGRNDHQGLHHMPHDPLPGNRPRGRHGFRERPSLPPPAGHRRNGTRRAMQRLSPRGGRVVLSGASPGRVPPGPRPNHRVGHDDDHGRPRAVVIQ
jgi:hypothetical protein